MHNVPPADTDQGTGTEKPRKSSLARTKSAGTGTAVKRSVLTASNESATNRPRRKSDAPTPEQPGSPPTSKPTPTSPVVTLALEKKTLSPVSSPRHKSRRQSVGEKEKILLRVSASSEKKTRRTSAKPTKDKKSIFVPILHLDADVTISNTTKTTKDKNPRRLSSTKFSGTKFQNNSF